MRIFFLSCLFHIGILKSVIGQSGNIRAKDSFVFSFPNRSADEKKAIKIDSLGTITDSAGINITWIDSLKAHNRGASIQQNKIYVVDTLTNQITPDPQKNRIFMDTIDVKNLYVNEQAKTLTRDLVSVGSFSQNVSSYVKYAADNISSMQNNNNHNTSPFTIKISYTNATPIIIDTFGLPQSNIPIKVNVNKSSATTLNTLNNIPFFYPTASLVDIKTLVPNCISAIIDVIDTTYFWLGAYKTFMNQSVSITKNFIPLDSNAFICNVSAAAVDGSKFYSFDSLANGGTLDTVVARWPFNTTSNNFSLPTTPPNAASAIFTTSNIAKAIDFSNNLGIRGSLDQLSIQIPKEQNINIYKIYKQLQASNPSKMVTTFGRNYPAVYQSTLIIKPSTRPAIGRFTADFNKFAVVLGFSYQNRNSLFLPALQIGNAANSFHRFGQSEMTDGWGYTPGGGGDVVWGISFPITEGKIFKTIKFSDIATFDFFDEFNVYALADKQDANGNWVSGDSWIHIGQVKGSYTQSNYVINLLPIRASTFIIYAYKTLDNSITSRFTNLSFTYDD